MSILVDEERTARKFYDCDASDYWRNYGPPPEYVTADQRLRAGRRRGEGMAVRRVKHNAKVKARP
jgi:hypothetical protein